MHCGLSAHRHALQGTKEPKVSPITMCFLHKIIKKWGLCEIDFHEQKQKASSEFSVLCSAQVYLSDGGTLRHARGVGGGVVGIVEGLVGRVRGNLILPIESMVAQLGNPFIKQLLGLNLESRYHNQKSTRQPDVKVRWRKREGGKTHRGTVILPYPQHIRSF